METSQINPLSSDEVLYMQLLEDEETYRETHPLRRIVPNEPQMDLLQALASRYETGKRRFLETCSNRNGKTFGLAFIVAAIVRNYRKGIFSILPRWTYAKKIWIVASGTNLTENIEPLLRSFLRTEHAKDLETAKNGKQYTSHWYIPETGFHINCRTFEQPADAYEGATVGMIWYDEPPPEPIYDKGVGRMIQGGIVLMAATPLFGAGFLYDKYVPGGQDPNSIYYHREAAIWDNVIEKAGKWTAEELVARGLDLNEVGYLVGENKGNITNEEAEIAISEMKEEEKDARIYGKFMFLSGRVYKKYDEKINKIRSFEINPNEYKIVCAIDPHQRRPAMVGWFAVDHENVWYMIDEWPRRSENGGRSYEEMDNYIGGFREMLTDMRRIEVERNLHLVQRDIIRVIDPRFGSQLNPNVGRTMIEEISMISRKLNPEYPFNFTPANADLDYRIKTTEDKLNLDKFGDPSFFIMDRCENTNNAMKYWSYKDFKGVAAEGKYKSEMFQEIYKDEADVVGFALSTNVTKTQEEHLSGWREKLAKKAKQQGQRQGNAWTQ